MVRVQKQEEEEEETHTNICTGPVRTSLPVLESASDFQINGGSISSVGGDSTSFTARRDVHVTINHHHSPSPTPSGSSSSSNSINLPDVCAYQGHEDMSSAHSRTHGLSSDATAQSNLCVRRNCDVYRQHLATKGRGLPLWNPEPGHTLPLQYQRQGITMGDVGVVTASGGFAFLFNIFLPKNHPINPPIMPEGFKPLKFIQGFDTVPSQRDLKDNSYLASPSSIQARRDRSAENFIFESSEYDGGILIIPVGAKSEDLACLGRLRKYVAANVLSWYRYACLRRGMEIENGDLKVVTGCDKTSAWGMACLSSSSSARPKSTSSSSSSRGSGEERRFYLEFGPTVGGGCLNRRGGRYEWAYSGEVAEVRAGPDACEVAQLRMSRGDGEVEDLEDETEHYENQCLFLRTMNATLPEETWQGLMLEEEEEEDDDEATREEEEDDIDPRYSHRSFGYRGNADGRSGISGQGSSTIRGGVRRNLSSVPSETVNNSGPSSTTSLSRTDIAVDASDMTSDFPSRLMSFADHPSITINRCLLQNSSPQTKMAISVDQDWMSVLREDDVTLPSSDELLQRILENYRVCENEGVVFLESKHTNQDHQTAVPPDVVEDETRNVTNLTPAQLEEFEITFRYYDKDETNTLALTELIAALASLGIVYSEEDMDPIYDRLVAEYGAVTFEAFINLLAEITEDQTAAKICEGADDVQELEPTAEDPKEFDRHPPDVFEGTSTAGVHRTGKSTKLKALLIGIDRPDHSGISEENEVHREEMPQPHTDLEIMRRYLIDDLGYDAENITVLVDNDEGDHIQPTRANILDQMRKLVEDARAGDQFFFLYSGHTGEEKTDEGQEEDGKNEFITTSDNGVIMDDELRMILVDPLPPDCSLFAVFDSCHTPSYPDIDHYRCNRVSLPWVSKIKQGTPKNTPSRRTFSVFKGLEDEGSPTLQGKESSSGRVQKTIPSGHQPELVSDDDSPFTRPEPPRLALLADPNHAILSDLFTNLPSRAGVNKEDYLPRNQDGKKPDIIFLSSSRSSKKGSSEDLIGNFIAQWLLDILAINLKYPLNKIVSQISHTVYQSFIHPLALAEPTSVSSRNSEFFVRGL